MAGLGVSDGMEQGRRFEMGRPATMILDVDRAIASGDIPMEQITGGVTVDAETGDLSMKIDEPEAKPAKKLTLTEIRADATADWLAQKGFGALRRELDRRHKLRDRTLAAQSGGSSSAEPDFPTMPRRITKKEREQADSVLRWHSRVYKNNAQAGLAW